MDKTYRRELVRRFIVESLPDPLAPRDSHLQIFDKYIETTRLRLRSLRVPETREWRWILEQNLRVGPGESRIAAINLNADEHRAFVDFTGSETRKNRYYWDCDGKSVEIDIFLGRLEGLKIARVSFESVDEMSDFEFPLEALEVTGDAFFLGESLVGQTFGDVQARVAAIVKGDHAHDSHVREVAKESE